MNARFYPSSDEHGTDPRGGMIMIVDGPGTGTYRRIVDFKAFGNRDTDSCVWRIDRSFPDTLPANRSLMKIAVLMYSGRNLFIDQVFEDTGHFQFYHSGVDNVVMNHRVQRMSGFWSAGKAVPMVFWSDNSKGAMVPQLAYFNEFINNNIQVGHRAPHAPELQNRSTFWHEEVEHSLFSFGLFGQNSGIGSANRFITFVGNSIVGCNGISIGGIKNADVLVADNAFWHAAIPISIGKDRMGRDEVSNYVLYNNSLGPNHSSSPILQRTFHTLVGEDSWSSGVIFS